jgi:hypothetical protein
MKLARISLTILLTLPITSCFWISFTDLGYEHKYLVDVGGKVIYEGNRVSGCIWTNGAITDVTDDGEITAVDKDLYTDRMYYALQINTGTSITGALVHDRQVVHLTDPDTHYSYIEDIDVRNGTVFVSGSQVAKSGGDTDYGYWMIDDLSLDMHSFQTLFTATSGVNSIMAIYTQEDGTVYAAGVENGISRYWKVDSSTVTAYSFLPADDGVITGITVRDGLIYMSGYYLDSTNEYPCYWIGATRHSLETTVQGRATGACWRGTTLWYSGFTVRENMTKQGCFWENGSRVNLETDIESRATAISVINGIAFTCGIYEDNEGTGTCYWQDSKMIKLPSGYYEGFKANDIHARFDYSL